MGATRSVVTITGTSPASASTAVLGTAINVIDWDSIRIECDVLGGTGGTLNLFVQILPIGGATWHDYAALAQLASGAAALSVTFAVNRHSQQLTIATVGADTTPLLAAGTVLGGDFGSNMRVVAKAGAGTSAGGVQTFRFYGSRL